MIKVLASKIASSRMSLKSSFIDVCIQFIIIAISICGERSGSVVECLTRDRVVAGSSLTDGTTLCP